MKCSNCGKEIPEDKRLPLQGKGYVYETDTIQNVKGEGDETVWWHTDDDKVEGKQVECPHCNEYVDIPE